MKLYKPKPAKQTVSAIEYTGSNAAEINAGLGQAVIVTIRKREVIRFDKGIYSSLKEGDFVFVESNSGKIHKLSHDRFLEIYEPVLFDPIIKEAEPR